MTTNPETRHNDASIRFTSPTEALARWDPQSGKDGMMKCAHIDLVRPLLDLIALHHFNRVQSIDT